MTPGNITGRTHTFGAPTAWNKAEHGPCDALPIRAEDTLSGPGLTSAWYPTAQELEALLIGAPVLLTILGAGHPPVMLRVGERTDAWPQ